MKQEVYEELTRRGLLDYGKHFPAALLRELAGIVVPELGTQRDFESVKYAELGIADFIRGRLLSKGRYLTLKDDRYRVLLPSENVDQVRNYMEGASKKLKRAGRLYDNTPPEHRSPNVSNRIHMRKKSIQDAKDRQKALN